MPLAFYGRRRIQSTLPMHSSIRILATASIGIDPLFLGVYPRLFSNKKTVTAETIVVSTKLL